MAGWRVLMSRLFGMLGYRRRDAELDAEVQGHLELLTEEYVRRGLAPDDARLAARREFGVIEPMKEAYRDQRGIRLLENLGQDLRYGWRTLRRNRGFTALAVVSLAFGIGANTAVFSLVHAVLLADLPVEDPHGLVTVTPYRGNAPRDFSYPVFRDLSRRQTMLSDLAASGSTRLNRVRIEGAADPLMDVSGGWVSTNYFSMLGVKPAAGRLLTASDSAKAAESAVVVISDSFWHRHFDRDRSAIGQTLMLNETPVAIVGVAPREFFGDRVGVVRDIWVPLHLQPAISGRNNLESRTATFFRALGRLKPGVSSEQAELELTTIFQQLMAEETSAGTGTLISRLEPRDHRVAIARGTSALNASARTATQAPLLLLMSAVSLVLLIACGNVANLLLSRAAARRREIAVRLAIGSSRSRLIRQLITESLLLGVLGGAAGLVLAMWLSGWLASELQLGLPQVGLHRTVLAFSAGLTLLAGLLFGLAPAIQTTVVDLSPALRAMTRTRHRERSRQRVSRPLIVLQVALSLWLLVGAGLMIRTLQNLWTTDLGIDRHQLMLVRLDGAAKPGSTPHIPTLRRDLYDRFRSLPSVAAVAFSEYGLFSGGSTTAPVRVPDSRVDPARDTDVRQHYVSHSYFETLGIRLQRGRLFTESEAEAAAPVTIVNEAMVRHYFGDVDPLGKLVFLPKVDAQGRFIPFSPQLAAADGLQIVGVVRDARENQRRLPSRTLYVPIGQAPRSLGQIVIRGSGDANRLAADVRQVVQSISDGVTARLQPLDGEIWSRLAQEARLSRLLGVFGTLALMLAAVGLYGVMAHTVSARTGEIGIRMALGARRGAIVSMILRESLVLVVFGVAVGLPLAMATTHLLDRFLFGLSPTDPLTLVMAVVIMLVVAGLAAAAPARRAADVDPLIALRCE